MNKKIEGFISLLPKHIKQEGLNFIEEGIDNSFRLKLQNSSRYLFFRN